MKSRAGFVSNSSSSSFILTSKEISLDDFVADIKNIWNQAFIDGECEDDENLDRVAKFIEPKKLDTIKARKWICEEYSNQCWDAKSKVSLRKRGRLTYLEQALKADVFGISDENEVPYPVLEKLEEKYGTSLIINHLG